MMPRKTSGHGIGFTMPISFNEAGAMMPRKTGQRQVIREASRLLQ